jgi:hypothetical protein
MSAVGSERLCMGYLVSRAIDGLGLSTASTYTALPNGGYTSISLRHLQGCTQALRTRRWGWWSEVVERGGGARWRSGGDEEALARSDEEALARLRWSGGGGAEATCLP